MSELVSVELETGEAFPVLCITTDDSEFFDSAAAVEVPRELIEAIVQAREAEHAAERRLAEWLARNRPEYVRGQRWISGF